MKLSEESLTMKCWTCTFGTKLNYSEIMMFSSRMELLKWQGLSVLFCNLCSEFMTWKIWLSKVASKIFQFSSTGYLPLGIIEGSSVSNFSALLIAFETGNKDSNQNFPPGNSQQRLVSLEPHSHEVIWETSDPAELQWHSIKTSLAELLSNT